MHVWYHKKDNLILFKIIPYLLWFFHQGNGQYFEIWDQGLNWKSCKMNTMQWSWSVHKHKEHVLLCGVMSFVLQLVSSSTAWGCGASIDLCNSMGARRWCRHLGRPPNTEPWSSHWNQWTLMKSKIPVTISMKFYANQAPATSFLCLCCG